MTSYFSAIVFLDFETADNDIFYFILWSNSSNKMFQPWPFVKIKLVKTNIN